MKTFSTILFVHDMPVGYTVLRSNDKISLIPAENPGRVVSAPLLTVSKKEGRWQVQGTKNPELVVQVLESIVGNEKNIPQNNMSAAV